MVPAVRTEQPPKLLRAVSSWCERLASTTGLDEAHDEAVATGCCPEPFLPEVLLDMLGWPMVNLS